MFSLMGNCVSCICKRQPKRNETELPSTVSQTGKISLQKLTLAILGLDSAGKSTTTKAFVAEPLDTAPTIGFDQEEFSHNNFNIVLFDLGGGKKIRDIWKNYLGEIYGIIYVIDSSSRERIAEVKENLTKLLENDHVKGKPILVLANKQDLPNAMDEVDLIQQLELEKNVNANRCPCKMELCSAIKGTGKKMDPKIKVGLTWLCTIIDQCFEKMSGRVKEDMEVIAKRKAIENEAKKERVRIIREEREKAEAERKKELGIEDEKDEDDEDMADGGPFRRVDDNYRDELSAKEAASKEKKRMTKEKERLAQEMERSRIPDITESKIGNHNTNTEIRDDDIPFRAPRSSRSLLSYGLTNGNGNALTRDGDSVLSGEENSDHILSRLPASRNKLPPLQSPLGKKFMDDREMDSRYQNNNNNKTKHRYYNDIDEDDLNMDKKIVKPLTSVSRIEVASHDAPSGDEDILQTGARTSYQLGSLEPVEIPTNNGRKKKGKKKKLKPVEDDDESSGFDTLRLSQNLEDDLQRNGQDGPVYGKPSGKTRGLKGLDGEDYISEERAITPVKKLKKKKKPLARKNKLGPSDDEFELSDVHDSPKKQPLPWNPVSTRASDNPDIHVPVSKWGLAEDIQPIGNSSRRLRPNFDSEDDSIL